MLTIRELLYYNLKFRFALTEEEYSQRIDKVIALLDLEKCQHTQVGDSDKKGISGGEKKRLCIALELVADIEVLVLDEPTSGLDTYSAFTVMTLLKTLAAKGLTIICTIHQPSSEIVALFQNIHLLCNGDLV